MSKVVSRYLYLFKKLHRGDKKLIWICAAMIGIQIVLPLSNVMFPKAVVWAVTKESASIELLMLILALFFIVSGICNATQTYFNRRNGFYLSNFTFTLREDIQELSMRMPFPMTEDARVLDRIRLAKEGCGRVQQMIESCVSCVTSVVLLMVYTVLLILLDWKILPVFLLCTAVDIFVMKKTKDYEAGCREEFAAAGRRKGYLFNVMSDYRFGKELRIFGMEDIMRQKYQEQCRRGLSVRKRLERRQTGGEMAGALLGTIAELTIYLTLFFLYLRTGLAADDFVMYVGVAASFHTMSRSFVESGTNMILLGNSIEDYRCFVEGNRHILEERSEDIPHTVSRDCVVVFDDVSFTYPGSQKKVLDHVSFTLEAGWQVSLVGENGAGKSTIVRLLCRFYRPDEGCIYLNGRDIQDYEPDDYLAQISAVFQESVLYAGTLEENICLDSTPDKARLWGALEMVGMDEKVRQLPRQEKSNVLKYIHDDGVEFSGGEKQRLCIARAVYKESGLLLLDEPTAALDALAEKEVYESFSRISHGRTVLFISHRLNSNRLCDKVIFMEGGRVCAQGTHEELMEGCGAYREMYNLQAQYYVKKDGGI